MEIAEHTIEVRRDAIPYDDWREDPRWDQLMEYVVELFGDGFMGARGVIRDTEGTA